MPEIAYVNGKFLPLAEAVVPVEDRGFQFADAVYEVLRTYRGELFAVEEHVRRLLRSLEAIQLRPGLTAGEIGELLREANRRGGLPESMVYLQISRGAAKRHRGLPADCAPTVVITVRALEDSSRLRAAGIRLITVPDQRWARCDIKSVALLANVLAYQTARQAGVNDALFVESDGTVNESTAGNVFIVLGGRFVTPPKGPRLLAGVTRDKIVELTGATERRITVEELRGASEVFLTSTTAEVVPVIEIDGHRVGDGQPGPKSLAVYQEFVRKFAGG